MTLLLIAITVTYVFLICLFIIGFFKIQEFNNIPLDPLNSFSILIPFRNESSNLPRVLESISKLNYPNELFEVLLINDESDDDYLAFVLSFIKKNNSINIRLIDTERKSLSPKKDALKKGVEQSIHPWILTTDADCILPNKWLSIFDTFIQKNTPVFIAGPITFKTKNSFLDKFQLIDLSALIGSTIGAFGIKHPFLCNGANLCYKKDAFQKVSGYEGNDHIASGDDIFLLEKFTTHFPEETYFLKSIDALVETSTMPNVHGLINQRIRWASKTTFYRNNFPKFIGLIILLMNIVFVFAILKSLIFQSPDLSSFFIISSKVAIDFVIIFITLRFKKISKTLIFYPIIAFIHPFFNLFIVILALSKKRYIWKNRVH